MPTTDLLKTFGLSRNPFTDRTAEKTTLDQLSLYSHSDLYGFKPNDTTYVFFGKRGSGKTTIRLQMERAYKEYNEQATSTGSSRGHFVVDLCRPGHMTACLRQFQEIIHATVDNWDAAFQDEWTSADMIDCVLCYAATHLLQKISTHGDDSKAMLEVLKNNPAAAKQFLLLVHLYARTDAAALAFVRDQLLKPKYTAVQVTIGIGIAGSAIAGATAAAQNPDIADFVTDQAGAALDVAERIFPPLASHPKLTLAALGTAAAGCTAYALRWRRLKAVQRVSSLQANIRVVRPQPPQVLASLMSALFTLQDTADTVRQVCIGVSAYQKLEQLRNLLLVLGYESLAVFGDCFDEVTLLDPVRFPGAIKIFAREVCRNDILNFGRLHFFFPDSRLALDLNTDKTLKEARFDRHFVRDLTWSRHQLEELAERRFRAAQKQLREEARQSGVPDIQLPAESNTSFADLFKQVRGEDFSSYISKLHTPRELLIMMTEMFMRIEANPEGGLTAQDMEIAVTKALEQAV